MESEGWCLVVVVAWRGGGGVAGEEARGQAEGLIKAESPAHKAGNVTVSPRGAEGAGAARRVNHGVA